jgi:hypothetical protein
MRHAGSKQAGCTMLPTILERLGYRGCSFGGWRPSALPNTTGPWLTLSAAWRCSCSLTSASRSCAALPSISMRTMRSSSAWMAVSPCSLASCSAAADSWVSRACMRASNRRQSRAGRQSEGWSKHTACCRVCTCRMSAQQEHICSHSCSHCRLQPPRLASSRAVHLVA